MNNILAGLAQVGAIVSSKIKENARSNRVPKVPDATYTDSPKSNHETGEASVSIIIDCGPDGAPAARAYEWGSGIHAEMGVKGKIDIPKKEDAKLLKFPKEDWPQYDPNFFGPNNPGPAPDWFVFESVRHPGVAARPYIRPAIKQTTAQVVSILGKAAKVELLINKNKVETIIVKAGGK